MEFFCWNFQKFLTSKVFFCILTRFFPEVYFRSLGKTLSWLWLTICLDLAIDQTDSRECLSNMSINSFQDFWMIYPYLLNRVFARVFVWVPCKHHWKIHSQILYGFLKRTETNIWRHLVMSINSVWASFPTVWRSSDSMLIIHLIQCL